MDKIREIFDSVQENESELNQVFAQCSDFVLRKISLSGIPCLVAFLSGLINIQILEDIFIRPLLNKSDEDLSSDTPNLIKMLETEWISIVKTNPLALFDDAVEKIVSGQAVFFIENSRTALALDIGNSVHRSLEEPKTEVALRGSYIGFIEKLEINIILLRQIIRTPALKVENFTVGTMTKTRVALLYIQNVASEQVINEARKRLSATSVNSVHDSGNLQELISESPYFFFPLYIATERPDTTSSSMLEGKIAIMMDGSSKALVAPATFWGQMQAADDYYFGVFPTIFLRWLRLIFTMMVFLLPSMFIAISSFHQEMIPTQLALTISGSEEPIPFPMVLEVLMMEIIFEVIREATLRMPRMVGQSIGIVGALILGQAAVQAGIVSAPVVIIVAIGGISSFLVPHLILNVVVRLLKYPLILLASLFGFYGMSVGLLMLLIHLVNLRSFGEYYLTPLAPFRPSFFRDVIIRLPWNKLKKVAK